MSIGFGNPNLSQELIFSIKKGTNLGQGSVFNGQRGSQAKQISLFGFVLWIGLRTPQLEAIGFRLVEPWIPGIVNGGKWFLPTNT